MMCAKALQREKGVLLVKESAITDGTAEVVGVADRVQPAGTRAWRVFFVCSMRSNMETAQITTGMSRKDQSQFGSVADKT